MPRSVNSVAKRARRKKVLKQAKGYFGRRKNKDGTPATKKLKLCQDQ